MRPPTSKPIPTPFPRLQPTSTPVPSPTPSLSYRLNSSTREHHTTLNHLITRLLPLSLPPHASTPCLYMRGISHILLIYEAFEGVIRGVTERGQREGVRDGDGDEDVVRGGIVDALRKLHIPQLERTGRLRDDIAHLRKHLGSHSQYPPVSDMQNPKLSSFISHITHTASSPHLLLAYTWLLYMALFSGGRHIRHSLRSAGGDFWNGLDDEKHDDIDKALTFWTFEGDQDGEDIKVAFKRSFGEVGEGLTEGEREEVVREGVFVMEALVGVVREIVEVVGEGVGMETEGLMPEKSAPCEKDGPDMGWLLLKHVLPMGMVELMSGAARAFMMAMDASCREVVGV